MANRFNQRGVLDAINSRCVEPQKRMVGGSYGWAVHRFPIRGGISLRDSLIASLSQPSTLGRWMVL